MTAKVSVSCKKARLFVMTSAFVLVWLTPGQAQTRNRFDLRSGGTIPKPGIMLDDGSVRKQQCELYRSTKLQHISHCDSTRTQG